MVHDFTPKPPQPSAVEIEQAKLFDSAYAGWANCLETNQESQKLFLLTCRRLGIPPVPSALALYAAGAAAGFSSGVMTMSDILTEGKITVQIVCTENGPAVVLIDKKEEGKTQP